MRPRATTIIGSTRLRENARGNAADGEHRSDRDVDLAGQDDQRHRRVRRCSTGMLPRNRSLRLSWAKYPGATAARTMPRAAMTSAMDASLRWRFSMRFRESSGGAIIHHLRPTRAMSTARARSTARHDVESASYPDDASPVPFQPRRGLSPAAMRPLVFLVALTAVSLSAQPRRAAVGGRPGGRRTVRRGRPGRSVSRRRFRGRDRGADREGARPHAAVRIRGICLDRPVGRARRRRHRPERHRGHAGPPRRHGGHRAVLRVPRGALRSRRDATRFRTLADLAGRRVGTLGGTIAYDILLARRRALPHRPRFPTTTTCIRTTDLLLGRVDAVLLDNVIAERRVRQLHRLHRAAGEPSRSATTSASWRRRTRALRDRSTTSCAPRCATAPSSRFSASGGSGMTISRRSMRRCSPATDRRRSSGVEEADLRVVATRLAGDAALPADPAARRRDHARPVLPVDGGSPSRSAC